MAKSGADTRKEIADDLNTLAAHWAWRGMPGLGRMLQIMGLFYLAEREGYLITMVNMCYDYACQFGPLTHVKPVAPRADAAIKRRPVRIRRKETQ